MHVKVPNPTPLPRHHSLRWLLLHSVPRKERPPPPICPPHPPGAQAPSSIWLSNGRVWSGARLELLPTRQRGLVGGRTMDGAADDAGRHRKKVFNDLVGRARYDLVRDVHTVSHKEVYEAAERQMEEEWEKVKPGEVNKDDVAAAADELVNKVAADTLETAFAEELVQRYCNGEVSDAEAEYELMAYVIGLSIAAEQNVIQAGSAVHPLVDEEAWDSTEQLYWAHDFHAMRFDPARVPPLFDRDVHDALMGMVAIRRRRCIYWPGHQWNAVHAVLGSPGIGLFTIHGEHGKIDISSGSTVLLHRADVGADSTTLVVAVVASKTLEDFAHDCDVKLAVPPPSLQLPGGVLVHSGFAGIAAELVTHGAIFDKIHAHHLDGRTPRVVWTGHSLGGAVATLLAAAYACRSSANARDIAVTAIAHVAQGDDSASTARVPSESRSRLVTMGTPRVGNEAAEAMFEALTTRTSVVAEGDTVPLWPTHTSFPHRFMTATTRVNASLQERIARVPVPRPAPLPTFAQARADQHILLHRKPARAVVNDGGSTPPRSRPIFPLWAWGFMRYHRLNYYLGVFVNLYDDAVGQTDEAATHGS